MCDFCEHGLDVTLEQKEISFGFLGDIELRLEIESADSTGYGENNINAFLKFGDVVSRISKTINFCPICGRDLRSKKNE